MNDASARISLTKSNVWRGASSQKLLYWATLSSPAPGVSLTTRHKEGHTAKEAGLGDSGTLHINSQGIGIEAAYMLDLFGAGDKYIARGKKSVMDTGTLCKTPQGTDTRVALKQPWTTGCIAPLCAGSAPHVVIGYSVGHHYVEHLCLASSAGDSGIYNQVGMKQVDNLCSTQSRIDLADTALHKSHFGAAYTPRINLVAKRADGFLKVETNEMTSVAPCP